MSPGTSVYDLIGVKGKIWMMQKVVILPFMHLVVKGAAQLTMHSTHMKVIVEPIAGCSDHAAIARSYGVLRPGIGKVDVCL